MFPRTKNRNKGTFGCSPAPNIGTRAHSPKPPLCETTLLFPLEKWGSTENRHFHELGTIRQTVLGHLLNGVIRVHQDATSHRASSIVNHRRLSTAEWPSQPNQPLAAISQLRKTSVQQAKRAKFDLSSLPFCQRPRQMDVFLYILMYTMTNYTMKPSIF